MRALKPGEVFAGYVIERVLAAGGKLAASLRHPNVATIYNAGEFEGRLYLTMEYIQGSDLRDEIDRHDRLMPRRSV